MLMDFLNDETLKRELKEGNQKTMVFLMDEYHKPLCLYVYSLTNDYELAQDIVQNVLVKIWEDRHKAESISSIRKYLYKAVYNRLLNHWRDNKRMLAIEEKHLNTLHSYIENETPDSLKKQIGLVKLEIQRLPARCKETFLLSKQEGLTNIEIASFMNVSLKTVENQMNKAFKILRKKLKDKINQPVLFLLFDSKFSIKIGLNSVKSR